MKLEIMGVLNTNPDSLYSENLLTEKAFSRAFSELQSLGCSVIDIGAESTSPYSSPIESREERRRLESIVLPFLLDSPLKTPLVISLDSYHIETVEWFLTEIGENYPLIWNDVSGCVREGVFDILHRFPRCRYIYAHNFVPSREKTSFHKEFVCEELSCESLFMRMRETFKEVYSLFVKEGMASRLIFDPNFGFAKNRSQNIFLLSHITHLIRIFPKEIPWCLGISRKSFLRSREALLERSLALLSELDFIQAYWVGHFISHLLHEERTLMIRTHNPLSVSSAHKALLLS